MGVRFSTPVIQPYCEHTYCSILQSYNNHEHFIGMKATGSIPATGSNDDDIQNYSYRRQEWTDFRACAQNTEL
jgi:hypothetical protein